MPKIEPTHLSPTGVKLDKLDSDAVRATQRLASRGYEAFLVGGCVRDHLLGRSPKDYDIATSARPQQVKRTFPRNCRIIGRRFKLAHLHFDRNTKILEVSTFRRTPEEDGTDDLLITRDNEFGTAEEDALRRDFTVNALFFDPTKDAILDWCDGLTDLDNRVIRTIGDPVVRFREDPVRILRAAKFAGRLGFSIEPETFAAMAETASDLVRAAPPRVLEEILRLLRGGHALPSFQLLRDVGALKFLVPVLADFLAVANRDERDAFWRLLEALDRRVEEHSVPQNAVLLGVLMVGPVLTAAERSPERSPSSIAEELLGPLGQELKLPRRDAGCLKRMCGVQHRFVQSEGKKRFRVAGFVHGPYFPEALELFELRVAAGSADREDLDRWLALADKHGSGVGEDGADDAEREQPRRKRRRGGRRRSQEDDEPEAANAANDDDTRSATDDDDEPGAVDAGAEPARRTRGRRSRGRKSEDVPVPEADAEAEAEAEAEETAARRPAAKRPAAKRPAAKRPAAKKKPRQKPKVDDNADVVFGEPAGADDRGRDDVDIDTEKDRADEDRVEEDRVDQDRADQDRADDDRADGNADADVEVQADEREADEGDRPRRRRRGRGGRGRSRDERSTESREDDGDRESAGKDSVSRDDADTDDADRPESEDRDDDAEAATADDRDGDRAPRRRRRRRRGRGGRGGGDDDGGDRDGAAKERGADEPARAATGDGD